MYTNKDLICYPLIFINNTNKNTYDICNGTYILIIISTYDKCSFKKNITLNLTIKNTILRQEYTI